MVSREGEEGLRKVLCENIMEATTLAVPRLVTLFQGNSRRVRCLCKAEGEQIYFHLLVICRKRQTAFEFVDCIKLACATDICEGRATMQKTRNLTKCRMDKCKVFHWCGVVLQKDMLGLTGWGAALPKRPLGSCQTAG